MKKSEKLCLVVSSLFLVMGLASCGTAGAKGDSGANGTNGTNGTDGKDGTNGKDGTSMLTGTTDPTSSTGNEGDVYLNSTSFDLFKKVNGVWTKIGNIKGKDGKDGQDGQDGEGGTSGVTTYSSTILPNENGYISVDKGSAKVGESITYTFVANNDSKINTFKINDETFAASSLTNGTYTTTMKADGLVVSGDFILKTKAAKVITTAQELQDEINSGSSTEITLIASAGVDLGSVNVSKANVTVNLTHNGSGTYNLNGLNVSGEGSTINFDSSTTNTITSPIVVSGANITVNGNGATLIGNDPISITDVSGTSKINNVTIKLNSGGNGGSSYNEGGSFNGIVAQKAIDNSAKFVNVAIRLDAGADVELENVVIDPGFDAAIYGYGDNLKDSVNDVSIKNCTISAGKYKGIYLGNVGSLDIEDSTFDGTSVTASQTTTLSNELKESGSIIDIKQWNANGKTVKIMNNKFNNLTDNGDNAGAVKIRTIETDSSTCGAFTSVDISGNTFTNNVRDIVIGKAGDEAAKSEIFGDSDNVSIQTKQGTQNLKVYDFGWTSKSRSDVFNSYLFENGQLYGSTEDDAVTKVMIAGVKFESGDGTASNPLVITDVYQFALLNNANLIAAETTSTHFRLDANLDFDNIDDYAITKFKGVFDGNGKTISHISGNTGLFNNFYGGTIKSLTFDNCVITGLDGEKGLSILLDFVLSDNDKTSCTIDHITINNTCSLTGHLSMGGVVGKVIAAGADVVISYCVNNAPINSDALTGDLRNIGGIVGQIQQVHDISKTKVDNCTNNGKISLGRTSGGYIGGVIGLACCCTVSNSKNNGNIEGAENINVGGRIGGIAGQIAHGTIVNYCENRGEIIIPGFASLGSIGGLVGEANYTKDSAYDTLSTSTNSNTISNSTNYAKLTLNNVCCWVGGCLGRLVNKGIVSSSTNSGNIIVTGTCTEIAGVIGALGSSDIVHFYSTQDTRYDIVLSSISNTGTLPTKTEQITCVDNLYYDNFDGSYSNYKLTVDGVVVHR